MPLVTKDYSVADDTFSGVIYLTKLEEQIRASDIVVSLDGSYMDSPSTTEPRLHIVFKGALSPADEGILAAIVADPSVAIPSINPTTKDGKPIFHLDAPEEDDGKPVVVMTPGPRGYRTFFTSRGDDPAPTPPASGRGEGPEIGLDIPSTDSFPKDYSAEWSYSEVSYAHDGQLCWKDPANFGRKDHFSLSVKGQATAPTVNGTNTGNCNLVNVGGVYNVIVPAAGDGTHDVDLATACPVPTGKAKNGFWDVDKETGAITPSATPGASKWLLLDIPFQSYFLRCVSMIHPMGVFDIDTYMAEWISERWTWQLDVHKETAPAADAEVAGWLYVFREHTT